MLQSAVGNGGQIHQNTLSKTLKRKNAADAEGYFSWHKNLLGNLRHNIDIDSTLQALSVIKYNSDTEELQKDIVPEAIKLFEKSYS